MAIKKDAPVAQSQAASSNAGETTSLLSNPPNYADSQPSSAYAHNYPLPAPRTTAPPAGPSPFHALPPPVTYEQRGAMQEADRRARKRFFGALLWGFGIWFAVGLLTGSIVIDEGRYRGGHLKVNQTVPHAVECNTFKSAGPGLARARFDLPLDSASSLLFSSLGPARGNALFQVDSELESAYVLVEARYDNQALFDESVVCSTADKNEHGIRIHAPPQPPYSLSSITYSLTFHLPPTPLATFSAHTSLALSAPSFPPTHNFTARIQNAGISLSDLKTTFLALSASNAHITLLGAETREADVWASNGAIRAKLSGEKLVLKAANSPISGSFDVRNILVLSTTNGPIEAEVALVGEGERYDVSVGTTNARAAVVYVQQPRGTFLTSVVETRNGGAEVRLHREFEGSFEASTTNAAVVVAGPREKTDGEHEGLERVMELQVAGKKAEGVVYWTGGKGDVEKRGRSKVDTTNAGAKVEIA